MLDFCAGVQAMNCDAFRTTIQTSRERQKPYLLPVPQGGSNLQPAPWTTEPSWHMMMGVQTPYKYPHQFGTQMSLCNAQICLCMPTTLIILWVICALSRIYCESIRIICAYTRHKTHLCLARHKPFLERMLGWEICQWLSERIWQIRERKDF